VKLLHPRELSSPVSDLVLFDADSIRQIARPDEPDLWVADPNQYESNGRILRDSEAPRMLAYSSSTQILYATDGCNSCAYRVPAVQLKSFAEENELPADLVDCLVQDLSV
jgi:hypothetical protein